MKAIVVIEVILGIAFVVPIGLLTLQDLLKRYPCHPDPFPDDDDLDYIE
jgi:hypothetical protein